MHTAESGADPVEKHDDEEPGHCRSILFLISFILINP